MTNLTLDNAKAAKQVREAAEKEFEATNPRPAAPEPPHPIRPSVIRLGNQGNLWIDTKVVSHWRNSEREDSIQAVLFFVAPRSEQGGPVRFEGDLEADELDALAQQLENIKQVIMEKRSYEQTEKFYQKHLKDWESERDEYARQKEAEWQRAQKKGEEKP